MLDIDTLTRTCRSFRAAVTRTILPAMFMVGVVVLLTAAQLAFAAPNPP
jgi:hypothetical protein